MRVEKSNINDGADKKVVLIEKKVLTDKGPLFR